MAQRPNKGSVRLVKVLLREPKFGCDPTKQTIALEFTSGDVEDTKGEDTTADNNDKERDEKMQRGGCKPRTLKP